jgi:molybdopterin molybdotransferase
VAIEEIDVAAVAGRVLAEPLTAPVDLPPFNRCLRDGYAVRSCDTGPVPVTLRLAGTVLAGQVATGGTPPGECWRVMTGARLPEGADAVVMQEEAEERAPDAVVIRRQVPAWTYVGRAGAEVRSGEALAAAGMRSDPPALALALACGRRHVRVHRLPHVGLLSTGSELVQPADAPDSGQIRASNPWMLAAAMAHAGAEVANLGIVPDAEEELRLRLEEGLGREMLVVSGGTGRGRADLTRRALEACGVEILFQGVAIEPGRPVLCGRRAATLVFGLPGTPLAAWILWQVLVAPCLRRLAGESRWELRLGPARLASPLEHPRGVEVWAPADLSWAGAERVARPRSSRGAGALRQHIGAPALVRIAPGDSDRTPAGSVVELLQVQS